MAAFYKVSIIFLIYFNQFINAKLILLNVIFRHGDRAPDNSGLETYPNDPYINETYFLFGLGGLTNTGKLRQYGIGQHLRKQYGNFLGDTYLTQEVRARSTDVDRTKMSLQLVLAGMYPPAEHQQWNPVLDWQPIPTEYIPELNDTLMLPQDCPKYLKARVEVEQSEEFQKQLSKFQPLMKQLTEDTGKNISNTNDMYILYHGLISETSFGLELPTWTYGIFPYGQLHDACVLEYQIQNYNDEMKRLNGGMLLRKITDDMTKASDDKLNPMTKVFLYSGHETNIAAVLQALDVYYPHVPRYSSAIIIELHENGNKKKHFVRVRYYRGLIIPGRDEVLDQEMQVPGCEKLCPLEKFKQVLDKHIAKDSDIPCDKRSLKSYLESGQSKLPYGITKFLLDTIYREESLKNELR